MVCALTSAAALVATTLFAEAYKQERAAENVDDEVTGTNPNPNSSS